MQKKIPLRKCLGCQEMKNKKELIRIVKNKENLFFVDGTGKMNGRGAYICNDVNCLERALKTKGLERTFQAEIPQDVYDQIKMRLEQYE